MRTGGKKELAGKGFRSTRQKDGACMHSNSISSATSGTSIVAKLLEVVPTAQIY
jgi:hypothetical protein